MRRYWRVGPRAGVCTESSAPQVAGCECSEQWQQPKFGLREVVQKVCRQAVLGGANLTVRTRRWAGCPYKTVVGSLVAREPNKFRFLEGLGAFKSVDASSHR